jgi:hypothetical protein
MRPKLASTVEVRALRDAPFVSLDPPQFFSIEEIRCVGAN